MRYLIVSDIHANWEALAAVVEDAGACDRIVCCGDLVGYGADPNPVVDWARAHVAAIIRGNHDKACLDEDSEDLEWFNPVARSAALWTRQALTGENLEYLRALPRGPLLVDGFELFHGSLLDEDEYLLSNLDAFQICPYVEAPLVFFGHTHLQGGFLCLPRGVRRIPHAPPGESAMAVEIEPDRIYLVNPGSVGQPRDGDTRAAYAIWEPEQRLVSLRRVPYDIEASQAKILSAGLPDLLAARLGRGL